jgi:hypothetical protein
MRSILSSGRCAVDRRRTFVGRTKLITLLINLFDSRSVKHITAIHNVVIPTP